MADLAPSDLHKLTENVGFLLVRPVKWTTQIRDLGDEAYVLLEPVQIVIEEYPDDSVVARFPEVEAFGEGETEPVAIMNLKIAILDLYDEMMEAPADELGKAPKMWRRILDRIIARS